MLIKLAYLILINMEVGQKSAVVLMDLSAAFDTVNHTTLRETFEKSIELQEKLSHSQILPVFKGLFILMSTHKSEE